MSARIYNSWIVLICLALGSGFTFTLRADAPHLYAITSARIVPVTGEPINGGTVIFRNGFIEAVGAAVPVPEGAHVIDGKGLTVYPGLIDMGNSAALEAGPPPVEPRNARTRMEIERWKRQVILRPHVKAADLLRPDAPELKRIASAGITSILAVPPGGLVQGQSSLLSVAVAEDAAQIGNIADERRGLYVLRTPVALHISFSDRARGSAYPQSLMGHIGFVRQAFADAQHYQLETARYERTNSGSRPVYDAALEGLQPSLARRMPVVLEADTFREILRALSLAKEFGLDPIVSGGRQADQAAADLKAQNARVLFSVNYPTRPRTLAPDADESLAALRDRANAPRVPTALAHAGVRFAFTSSGLTDPRDFLKNVSKAVNAGLAADAALRALTMDAAAIAGASSRLGSIEKGKIANLIVTEGDIFDEKMRIRHVFIDGRPIVLEPAATPDRRSRPGT
jgi:imidazolonepropionase-like amidohydrolase